MATAMATAYSMNPKFAAMAAAYPCIPSLAVAMSQMVRSTCMHTHVHSANAKASPGAVVAANTTAWVMHSMNQNMTFQGPASPTPSEAYWEDSDMVPD